MSEDWRDGSGYVTDWGYWYGSVQTKEPPRLSLPSARHRSWLIWTAWKSAVPLRPRRIPAHSPSTAHPPARATRGPTRARGHAPGHSPRRYAWLRD